MISDDNCRHRFYIASLMVLIEASSVFTGKRDE